MSRFYGSLCITTQQLSTLRFVGVKFLKHFWIRSRIRSNS